MGGPQRRGRIDTLRLRAEIEAQLDRFEDGVGHGPAHVDGHQHVHQLPGVREVLLSVLAGRYDVLPWVRSTRACPEAGTKARVIEALGERGLRALCETTDWRRTVISWGCTDSTGARTAILPC